MFKILKENMPSYLRTLFSIRNTEYNLRNNQFKLNLPKPQTNYLKRSLTMGLYYGIAYSRRYVVLQYFLKKLIVMLIHIDSDSHSAIL